MSPEIFRHPLSRADGSAILSSGLYAVIASVNGPVEVQRRDELPEEAAIEVNIRPSAGIGGPRERWLETIILSTLKSVLLASLHPRTLIQVTLQVTKELSTHFRSATADVSIIPTLVNSAFIALVDSGLPLSTTLISTLAIVCEDSKIVLDPKEQDIAESRSMHAMAYNGHGEQVLSESWGTFDLGTWEKVAEATREECIRATAPAGFDAAMTKGASMSDPWLRTVLEDRARAGTAWRGDGA